VTLRIQTRSTIAGFRVTGKMKRVKTGGTVETNDREGWIGEAVEGALIRANNLAVDLEERRLCGTQ